MKVDKKQIDSSIILMDFSFESPAVIHDILRTGLFQKELDGTITPSYRSLRVACESESALSDFNKRLRHPFELDLNDGFIYDCLLYAEPQITSLGSDKYIASFPLSVIRKKQFRELRLKSGQKFNIDGTCECGVRYDIVSQITGSIVINNIEITNVKVNDRIVIDGINMLVTCNGKNKFADSDLIKFPTLSPGLNIIGFSENMEVSLGYYPIFM